MSYWKLGVKWVGGWKDCIGMVGGWVGGWVGGLAYPGIEGLVLLGEVDGGSGD